MEGSEKKRQSLEERDFPILESMTLKMLELIEKEFQFITIDDTFWPKRYSMVRQNFQFEWVFSAMGSVTLRLAKDDRYKKNPPPIFYISVGKYDGKYVWEDYIASEVPFDAQQIKKFVEEKLSLYLSQF
jgi:hypothetical protein